MHLAGVIGSGGQGSAKRRFGVIDGDLSARMDRSSALPLWAQLRADLVDRIAAGEFTGGSNCLALSVF
jgi:hypothetical protein